MAESRNQEVQSCFRQAQKCCKSSRGAGSTPAGGVTGSQTLLKSQAPLRCCCAALPVAGALVGGRDNGAEQVGGILKRDWMGVSRLWGRGSWLSSGSCFTEASLPQLQSLVPCTHHARMPFTFAGARALAAQKTGTALGQSACTSQGQVRLTVGEAPVLR